MFLFYVIKQTNNLKEQYSNAWCLNLVGAFYKEEELGAFSECYVVLIDEL